MRSGTVLCLAAALTAVTSASVCRPGVAAPAPYGGKFVLTSFRQRGRTDVYRNEVLEFRFSQPLRRGSVSDRSLQIGELTKYGFTPAAGARIVAGNVVRFDPQITQRTYDRSLVPSSPWLDSDHAEGFSPLAPFAVSLPSSALGPSLRSRDGRRLAHSFAATFGTGTAYLDPVPGQPWFSGDRGTGVLGFDPPRQVLTGLVDPDASIVLEFSEPILPASLVPGTTVFVTRAGGGTQVTGTVSLDPGWTNGRQFLFKPTGEFGFAPNGDGWDVVVTLGTGITDLAGNQLKRGFQSAAFRTRSAPQ